MLSVNSQRKIYNNYKNGTTTKIGRYYYTIAYNACASIHTFIIRSDDGYKWHWLQPLDKEVN